MFVSLSVATRRTLKAESPISDETIKTGVMEDKYVVLRTKLGQLRGHTRQSVFSDKTYYAFQGIPYAKPPLGELRFKAPQPFGSWEGIRDALEDGNDPKQPIMFPLPGMDPNKFSEGDEDCLYLNVFINELPQKSSTKKPVMFSIHGGGFSGGSGSMKNSGPDFLLEGDVIVVTINYRCGAFGFLSLENEDVPGNAGLKDQTLALTWVRDNIGSFGGDPNNVTILGRSAGGASVHFHLLSLSSKGLFHKAIIQSGCALNPWAIQKEPRTAATLLAMAMGCTSENTDEILKVILSASADDIILATKRISRNKALKKRLGLIFSPCVEVSGKHPFLTDTPINIMKKGDFKMVPVILGGCVSEGSLLFSLGGMNEEMFKIINTRPEVLVSSWIDLKCDSAEEREAAKAIWDFYFHGNPLSQDNAKNVIAYFSDVLFNVGMEETRLGLVKKSSSPVYTYLFTNHSRCFCSIGKSNIPENCQSGTCHGAEHMFLYVLNKVPQKLTNTDKEAILKLVKAWTAFASVGDPNCTELEETWQKDSKNKPCFMEIGTTWAMKEGITFKESFEFWNKLQSKYCAT